MAAGVSVGLAIATHRRTAAAVGAPQLKQAITGGRWLLSISAGHKVFRRGVRASKEKSAKADCKKQIYRGKTGPASSPRPCSTAGRSGRLPAGSGANSGGAGRGRRQQDSAPHSVADARQSPGEIGTQCRRAKSGENSVEASACRRSASSPRRCSTAVRSARLPAGRGVSSGGAGRAVYPCRER